MKSAYEIAMERLNKSTGPARKLSDPQKARIAEIEKKHEAKLAETKMSYDGRLEEAQSLEELNNMKAEMAAKIRSLEETRDAEKDAVWNEG